MRPYGEEIEDLPSKSKNTERNSSLMPPNEWDDHVEYEEYLGEVKTAMILNDWIEETPKNN